MQHQGKDFKSHDQTNCFALFADILTKVNLQNAESLPYSLLPHQALVLNLLTIQGPTENRLGEGAPWINIIIIFITIELTWGKNEASTIRLRSMNYVGLIYSGSANRCWLQTYRACVKET